MQYQKGKLIGGYYLSFDKKSAFIYKTISPCFGFIIIRDRWKCIIENFQPVSNEFKQRIKSDYETNVKITMNVAKQNEIKQQMAERSDIKKFKFVSSMNQDGVLMGFNNNNGDSVISSE